MATPRTPIVLCIDVEPDLDFFITERDRSARATANIWDSFEASADFFESLRATLPVEDKPIFSWFVRADPQVAFDFGSADYGFTRFRGYIENWKAQGDEIGLHVHAWRHNSAADDWIEDRTDQEWVSNCVLVGFEAYRQQMGHVPRSFRFGARWINTPTMNLLRSSGVGVDMTIEPGYRDSPWAPYLRGLTDWENVPRRPYTPSLDDYTSPSDGVGGGFIELPLTMVALTRTRKLEKMFGTMKRMIAGKTNISQIPHGPTLKELGWYLQSRYGRLDLLLSSDQFRKATRSVLDLPERPYFGLILRSDECPEKNKRTAISRNLETLVEEIRRSGRAPIITAPTNAIEILRYT